MNSKWSADMVGKMHTYEITQRKLAELTSYSPEYISMILNGKRDTKKARETIERVLTAMDKEE